MPDKKRKQLSSKQIFMITLIILGVGSIMLVASILLAPTAEPVQETLVSSTTGQPSSEQEQGEPLPKKPVEKEPEKPAATSTSSASHSQSQPDSSQKPTTVVVTPQTEKPASSQQTSQTAAKPQKPAETPVEVKPAKPEPEKPAVTVTPASPGAKLVFVFDDAGHNLNQLQPFLELPFDCVIAVLPSLSHSGDAAAAARKAGKQVILHQPMQAVNLSVDPGPSAIKPDMHTYEIEALVKKNLAELGPVSGINNHEGSLITATQSAIGAVLDVCKEEGIFFLDSRTNAETKAPIAARERGMTIYERDIFLDNTQDRDDIIAMINKGLAVADKKGHAVMIGHIWSDGLAAILEELYPELVKKGYVFTDLSGL